MIRSFVCKASSWLAALILVQCPLADAQFQGTETVLHTLNGVPGTTFGWTIKASPDLDGDHVRDLLISVVGTGTVRAHSGRTGQLLHQLVYGNQFGYSMDSAGDVNADGVADIVAGAPVDGSNGRALVLSGVDGRILLNLSGLVAGERFGTAAAGAGDVDGDGHADVLVGAEFHPAAGIRGGAVYVLSGRNGQLIRRIDGDSAEDRFGGGAALGPDLDGDGLRDHLIGAYGGGTAGRGEAYVHSAASGVRLRTFRADAGAGNFGRSFVVDVGDVDADGTGDVYVGDWNHASGAGRGYVFSGATSAVLQRFSGAAGDGCGPGRGAGDVNGDGHADLIVGCYTAGAGGLQAGQARIYSGKDGSVLKTWTHTLTAFQFGYDAVGLGDVNADGRLDFAVSAGNGSRVYVFAGAFERPLRPPTATVNYSDTWWQANEPGWGFNVLHQGQLVYGTWYSYAEDGRPMFLTVEANLQAEGHYAGPVYRVNGVPLAQISGAQAFTQVTAVGNAELRFRPEGTLALAYTVLGSTQQKLLQPFRFSGLAPLCFGSTAARHGLDNYSDLWWSPREAGWGLTLAHQGEAIFALWYTYADDGRSQWLSASSLQRQPDGSFSGVLERPLAGTPLSMIQGAATGFPVPRVGTARLRFSDGENGVFAYSVDGVNQSKVIRRFTPVASNQPRLHCVHVPTALQLPSE